MSALNDEKQHGSKIRAALFAVFVLAVAAIATAVVYKLVFADSGNKEGDTSFYANLISEESCLELIQDDDSPYSVAASVSEFMDSGNDIRIEYGKARVIPMAESRHPRTLVCLSQTEREEVDATDAREKAEQDGIADGLGCLSDDGYVTFAESDTYDDAEADGRCITKEVTQQRTELIERYTSALAGVRSITWPQRAVDVVDVYCNTFSKYGKIERWQDRRDVVEAFSEAYVVGRSYMPELAPDFESAIKDWCPGEAPGWKTSSYVPEPPELRPTPTPTH